MDIDILQIWIEDKLGLLSTAEPTILKLEYVLITLLLLSIALNVFKIRKQKKIEKQLKELKEAMEKQEEDKPTSSDAERTTHKSSQTTAKEREHEQLHKSSNP